MGGLLISHQKAKLSLSPARHCIVLGPSKQTAANRNVGQALEMYILWSHLLKLMFQVCYNFSVVLLKPCSET